MRRIKRVTAFAVAMLTVFGSFSSISKGMMWNDIISSADEYQIEKEEMAQADSAELINLGASQEEGSFTVESDGMSNEFLRLYSYNNGRFRLNTTCGDPAIDSDNNKLLLYHGATSYSTIVIDGTANIYGGSGLTESATYDMDAQSQTTVAKYGNITVKQILSFVDNTSTGRRDVLEIRYEVTNEDAVEHTVGTRIMLDTMLGGNDSAPFRVAGHGNVTTETEYTAPNIPQYWQAFDTLTNPTVISQGSFLRNDNAPDKVQFTNWGNVESKSWNYEIKENRSNGDSAVSVIWNEKALAPGETRSYVTHYGLSELTQDVAPPLAISMYSDNTAFYDPFQARYMPLDVTAYIENIGEATAQNAYVRIELPEGMELADLSEGVDYEFIDNLAVGDTQSRTWHINISNSIQTGRAYPVRIVCGADGIEEKAVVREILIPDHENGNVRDNRIDWGQEKKDFWGNGTDKYPGVDNLAFTNISKNIANYAIPIESLKKLTVSNGMDWVVYNYVKKQMDSKWGGSCYGMATIVSLIKTGHIHPQNWISSGGNSSSKAHDIKIPKKDQKSQELVNYYHLMQFLPDIQDLNKNHNEVLDSTGEWSEFDDSEALRAIVSNASKVKNGGYPVSLGFCWIEYKNLDLSDLEVKDDNGNIIENANKNDYSNADVIKSLLSTDYWYSGAGNGQAIGLSRDEISFVNGRARIKWLGREWVVTIMDKDTLSLSTIDNPNDLKAASFKRASNAGHRVVAYDVDTTDHTENINGNTFNYHYRVSICDPNGNAGDANHWTYLYISEDYNNWYYGQMSRNASSDIGNVCRSTNGTEYKYMRNPISDISLLDIINLETGEDRSVLKHYNSNFISSYTNSVNKVESSNGKYAYVTGLGTDGNLDSFIIPYYGKTEDGVSNQDYQVILPDGNNESYTIYPKNFALDSSMICGNYMFSVSSDNAKKSTYDPSGFVEVDLNNSNYELEATFNEGNGNSPWFTMKANGGKSEWAKLLIADEGFILESNNLTNTSVTGSNLDSEVNVKFSTDKTSVQLKPVDNDTLGVFIDNDNNGTYETIIADSDGKTYNQQKDISEATVTLAGKKVYYKGKSICPKVTVTYNGKKLVKCVDYRLIGKNSVKPGKATVIVKGIGDYTGQISKTYVIAPAKVSLTSAKSNAPGKVTINWVNDGMADGYQVWASHKKSFASCVKKYKVNGNKTSATFKGLTACNRYYIKIRPFKIVDGKRYYGRFSNVKSAKIKVRL